MIREHYDNVKKEIASSPQDVTLCIVTKYRSIEEILTYYNAGERDFAENRVKDLVEKAAVLPEDIRWHCIGHLQRNKVRTVLPYVSLIQSLDSKELADVIEKEAARINKDIDVLAEVHLATEDENKTGLSAEELLPFLTYLKTLPHIRCKGIMAMGPHTDDAGRIHEVFHKASEVFAEAKKRFPELVHLSMGMSGDYPIALAEGATMVRIGTYLFVDDQTSEKGS